MQTGNAVAIRLMTRQDIPFGERLTKQAGWRQVEADWCRALELEPEGCFVAEWGGTAVGTTTLCRFGVVAWIAMVLVDSEARGRGIGRRLLEHALQTLGRWRVETARLDATALGQPLYEKLGFVGEYEVVHFTGQLTDSAQAADPSRPVTDAQWQSLLDLDMRVTATDRRRLLQHLRQYQPDVFRCIEMDGVVRGYMSGRDGVGGMQLGPAIADDPAAMRLLLDAMACRWRDQVVCVDIPVANVVASDWARAHGLQEQRRFLRMSRGRLREDHPQWCAAGFGPEKG